MRIEDVDTPRCLAGAAETILGQLAGFGLVPDATPVWQSHRGALYQRALETLISKGCAYACACSRKDIEAALAAQGAIRVRHGELVYPGTCRQGLAGRRPRAWRLLTDAQPLLWNDGRLGAQQQDVQAGVGDFVLQRADGLWAYQLAVVVDDGDQHITHVVRGADLADNTARQILLQRALGLPTPHYLHTPLVLGPDGEKLSKQNGAAPVSTSDPLTILNDAATVLGLPVQRGSLPDALSAWILAWRDFYNRPGD